MPIKRSAGIGPAPSTSISVTATCRWLDRSSRSPPIPPTTRSPYSDWNSSHLARALFNGIDGDIRVEQDTIVVTLYNAPHAQQLRLHYQDLPRQLEQEHIDPRIPWLYHYKLDFRFK